MSYKNRGGLYNHVVHLLNGNGVSIMDMADLVYIGQKKYMPELTIDAAISSVKHVLSKREVQNVIITALALDDMSQKNALSQPLQYFTDVDLGVYGVDEILAMGITNVFGSIAISNYFYLDKMKPGIIGELNTRKNSIYIDDVVGAIIGSAEARLAHKNSEDFDEILSQNT